MTDWTLRGAPRLDGKVMIVTGGNSGIGYEAVRSLAERGAHVIMASRNMEKATAARQSLDPAQRELVEILHVDLANLSSVRSFAKTFLDKYDRLNALLNNAGISMVPYEKTMDGFEPQLGTNHFGHFLLTGLLFPVLSATPASRVVNVSSLAHKRAKLDVDNLTYDDGASYSKWKAYERSKLANLLFTFELQNRCAANNLDVVVLAAHPGASDTSLGDHVVKNPAIRRMLKGALKPFLQSAEKGALPSLRAILDPSAKTGDYFGPDGFQELWGAPVRVQAEKNARDQLLQRRLWEASERLTGIAYP